jgi:tetratricopeptide (TPR) repeat protein
MKTLVSIISLSGILLAGALTASAGTSDDLLAAGKAAAETGDFDAAKASFDAAIKEGESPKKKEETVVAIVRIYGQVKKSGEAMLLLKEVSADESYPPQTRRMFLRTLAGMAYWGKDGATQATRFLEEGIALAPETDEDEEARTALLRGAIYDKEGDPDRALKVRLTVLDMKGHPAVMSEAAAQIGKAYLEKNDKANARKYYEASVEYGKQVKYKYDFSGSERALEELNK